MFDPVRSYDKPGVIIAQLANGIATTDSVRRVLFDPAALSPRERESFKDKLKAEFGGNAVTDTAVDVLTNPLVWMGVLASAGVFASARGGQLDLMLRPRQAEGRYDGRAEMTDIRVVDAPILAELLNAVSVVGMLEQLNGDGLLFSQAQADFVLTPRAVEIQRGSAVGVSLGVSMAGVYGTESKELALQGVVSPIYMLNGIGSVLTRRGEGLFGFNYEVRGTAERAQATVNPLSILTPGMFRDLFRGDPPRLGNPDG